MKISGNFNYYKTDKDNEYICYGGDKIIRFEKITDKCVYYNRESCLKFEDNKWFIIHRDYKSNKILNQNEDYFEIRFKEKNLFRPREIKYYLVRFYNKPYSCYENTKSVCD